VKEFYEEYWEHRKNIDHIYDDWIPKRLEFCLDRLEKHGCETVLDIGCGEGTLGELAPDSVEIFGVDISETALTIADEHYTETAQIDLENDNLKDKFEIEFDAVVCLEVLEHLINPKNFLSEMVIELSEDALFIISVPNFVFWNHRFKILFGNLPENYTLYKSSEHISNFNLSVAERTIQKVGLSIVEIIHDYSYPVVPDRLVPNLVGSLAPDLLSRQIIFVCKTLK
jgi:2-polyprenyl-3-methyl-5-hydroxy-6-metoxy-1,4-benzoquinol methylase